MSIIETLQTLGIPVFSMPDMSLVFIWNESISLNLYQEYDGELTQIDVRTMESIFPRDDIGYHFGRAYNLAKDWADEIRQSDKETNEG